jgi:hypothetical protein
MSFCEGCTNYVEIDVAGFPIQKKCLIGVYPGGIKCLNNRKTSDAQKSIDCIDALDSAVDKPTHYTSGAVECIDAIRSALTADEFRGYCKGNIMKYVWRERLKNQDQDLQKAAKYLEWLIAEMQKNGKKVE